MVFDVPPKILYPIVNCGDRVWFFYVNLNQVQFILRKTFRNIIDKKELIICSFNTAFQMLQWPDISPSDTTWVTETNHPYQSYWFYRFSWYSIPSYPDTQLLKSLSGYTYGQNYETGSYEQWMSTAAAW